MNTATPRSLCFEITAPFILNHKWSWKTWRTFEGNKHAAIIAKGLELNAQGWDFGQADMKELGLFYRHNGS